MSEERLKEIKDSVNFQREILKAHNMETLCIDEEQELIEEIERLNKELEQEKKDFKEANDKCFELTLENKRLNNIINELEKWLEEDESKAMITFETGRCFNYHDIINKIEILKRSDKE